MIPAVRWIREVSSLQPKERCFDDETLIGQSTQMLASFLGSGGANGGFNPLYQIGGARSIQLALKLQF